MASTTHLLADEPTIQDAFGTHDRVATAVAELIKTEKSCKAVALIGPWGGGKSSVLRMIQKQLAGFADVFIFDAWTHEGDPLRRTFLETLITFLGHNNLSTELRNLRDEITLRKKTKEETTTPILTWEARAMGFLLIMVPVGLAMFAAMVRMKEPSWPLTITAFIIALLPLAFVFILGLGVGLRKTVVKAWRSRRKIVISTGIGLSIGLVIVAFSYRAWLLLDDKPRVLYFLVPAAVIVVFAIYRSSTSGILPLLFNRTVTTTRSESVESPEPSSIEFQRWFRSIVAIHHNSRGRRLVIAIDNLDRINRDLARQLWATMRTFFDLTSEAQPEKERIWLLTAFDKEAVQSLWTTGDPDSFIKKTFQASFSVPSLVLIHRDDYMNKQLRAAFPAYSEGLFAPIIRLYSLNRTTEISTPRDIITFVNAIGSIHRQWRHEEIPLLLQAQYVLAAQSGPDIMNILTAVSTSQYDAEELLGRNWQEYLAAIHFNVLPRDVAHVFMPPLIIRGLTSGIPAELADLATIRGFGSVLSEVVFRNKELWKQASSVARAIVALASLKVNEEDQGIKGAWRILTKAASRMEKWDTSTETANALSILIRRSAANNEEISELLRSAGRAVPRGADNNVDSSEDALTRFTKTLAPVFDLLIALPPSFQMVIYGSAQTYLNTLNVLTSVRDEQFEAIASRLDTESRNEIPCLLGESIKTVQLKENAYRVVKAILAHYPGLDWQPVIQAIEYLFGNTGNNFLQIGYKAALEALLVLASSDPPSVRGLENLARNGSLYHYLAVADDRGSKDLALLLLLLYSDGSEPAPPPGKALAGVRIFRTWLEGPDSASLGVIAGLVGKFGQRARLQSRESQSGASKELAAGLRLLADRSELSHD